MSNINLLRIPTGGRLTGKEPIEYGMTVHLFGAISSSGCSNFSLRPPADQYENFCGIDGTEFIRKNVYVDDGLKSVTSIEQAQELIRSTTLLCYKRGFPLHMFTSNIQDVVNSISPGDRGNESKEGDLGVHWCLESDALKTDKPFSRRGILSEVSSVFDPHGLVSPFIQIGKTILQELTVYVGMTKYQKAYESDGRNGDLKYPC